MPAAWTSEYGEAVSLENKSAKVIIDPIVADETLRNAIEEAGYVLNEIL